MGLIFLGQIQVDIGWVDRYGFPLVALVILAGATWGALRWVAREMKPLAQMVARRHITFLDSLEETQKNQTAILEAQRADIAFLKEVATEWRRSATKTPGA